LFVSGFDWALVPEGPLAFWVVAFVSEQKPPFWLWEARPFSVGAAGLVEDVVPIDGYLRN
jgi:hypothetical protein